MTLPKPKALIFDWDNTLVDTWPVIHAALEHTFLAMGLEPWPFEVTKARVRKSMRDSFPEIFGANWQQAGEIYQAHFRANHLLNLTPLPGAQKLLEYVSALGLPSVVVSNKKGPNLRQEVAHLKWQPHFMKVVGADDAARDKPHADPVLMALEGSGIEPSAEVWFIGDSEIDLETAKNTGCTPVLYGDTILKHPEFTSTHYHGFPYLAHALKHSEIEALLHR